MRKREAERLRKDFREWLLNAPGVTNTNDPLYWWWLKGWDLRDTIWPKGDS